MIFFPCKFNKFLQKNNSIINKGAAYLVSRDNGLNKIDTLWFFLSLMKSDSCFQIPFQLVTRLWDTYLAEGDALPDFLVYIFASFLLTVSLYNKMTHLYNSSISFSKLLYGRKVNAL